VLEVYPIGRPDLPPALDLGAVMVAIDRIEALPAALRATLDGCGDLDHPIRDGAWPIRAVVHHLADTHMNAFLRSKRVLTEDAPTVESVDIDAWATTPDARLPLEPSLDLIAALHLRWVELLRGASPADLERTWHVRADPAPRTAWRLALIYGWHGDHHVAQIRQAREHYGL
jgi:hypothetical protein